MKIEEEPKYRIKYIECSVKEHQGEKANIVCLEDSCKDKSIICSLCTSEGHLNHQTIPIKFHIDAQHKKYKQFPLDYEKELSVVEQQKNVLLIKLRNTVEEIAEAFMKLEQEIILQYDEIKNHLIQVEQKRNHFQEMYVSLIKENYGEPQFIIQNFLIQDQIRAFQQTESIQAISKKTCDQINKISKSLVTNQAKVYHDQIKAEKQPEMLEVNEIFHPNNILKENQLFSLVDSVQQQNIFLIKNFQEGSRLKLKIVELPGGSYLAVGTEKEAFLKTENYFFKENLFHTYFTSKGITKNGFTNMGQLLVGDVIDIFIKKSQLKFKCKGLKAQLNGFANGNALFVGLIGKVKLEVTLQKK